MKDLIADLLAVSDTFAAMWESHVDTRFLDYQVTVHHPDVGDITVDCDLMTIHEGDLRAVIYTAEPGSENHSRLVAVHRV